MTVWTIPSTATLPLPHHVPGKDGAVELRTANGTIRSGGVDARGSGINFLGSNYWKGTVDGAAVIVYAGSNGSEDPATGAVHGDRAGASGPQAFDALGPPVTVPGAGAMWIVGEDGEVLTIRGEDDTTYRLDLRSWTLDPTD